MANIIINVEALQCQAPIITNVQFTGARYVFSVDWESRGDEYFTIDPTTKMQLKMDIYETSTPTDVLTYSAIIDYDAPFNTTNYTFDVLNYTDNFSSKYYIILTLFLASETLCNEETSYQVPVTYS